MEPDTVSEDFRYLMRWIGKLLRQSSKNGLREMSTNFPDIIIGERESKAHRKGENARGIHNNLMAIVVDIKPSKTF